MKGIYVSEKKEAKIVEQNGNVFYLIDKCKYNPKEYKLIPLNAKAKKLCSKLQKEARKSQQKKPQEIKEVIESNKTSGNISKTVDINGQKYVWEFDDNGKLIWKNNKYFKSFQERTAFYQAYESQMNGEKLKVDGSNNRKVKKETNAKNTPVQQGLPVAEKHLATGVNISLSEVKEYISVVAEQNPDVFYDLYSFTTGKVNTAIEKKVELLKSRK